MNRSARSRPVLLAGLAALGLLASACGSASTALEVGDRSLSREDLVEQLEDFAAAAQPVPPGVEDASPGGVDAALTAQWSSWWIRFTALGEWADAEGIEVTDADLAESEALLAQSFPDADVQGNTALQQLVPWQALISVLGRSEALLEGNVLCARHILLETEEEAEEVVELLAEGEDFGELAAERSVDPSAATNLGELGCNPRGALVPEFEEPAFAAAPGDIVGPVETQFGYHVIEVLPLEGPGLDTASQAVQASLIDGTNPILAEVLADEDVAVDPRYGDWSEQFLSVVPPSGPLPAEPALLPVPDAS